MNLPIIGNLLNPSTVEVADMHRKQQLLLGYLIAKASNLALIANTIVVPCGLVVLAYKMTNNHPSPVLIGVFALIGIIVAILADSMTLATAARIRKASERFGEIDQRYDKGGEKLTAENEERKAGEKVAVRWGMGFSILFLVFFIVVSGGLGDVFWSWSLQGIGDQTLEWTFSTIFSLLISGVMCASELYRRGNDSLIRESIESTNFMAVALKQDADAKAIAILAEKYKTEITELAENTDTIKQAISDHGVSVYDQLLLGGKGELRNNIKQAKDAREYAVKQEADKSAEQWKVINGGKLIDSPKSAYERVAKFMEENPRAINKDIVAAFPDIPEKTVKVYASQVRSKAS